MSTPLQLTTALIALIITSLLLINGASADAIYPQNKSTATELREDLPAYVFEYDLERLYPATWEFYKKLDIIKRDNVYSRYLYHPAIKDVRHHIFKLVFAEDKGRSHPAPTSFNQLLTGNTTESKPQLTTSGFLSSIHGIANSPTVGTIKLYSNFNQTVNSFLEHH